MTELPILAIDIGGVIAPIDLTNILKYLAEKYPTETFFADQNRSVKRIKDSAYTDFEMGMVTPEDYHRHIIKLLKIEVSYTDFVEAWNSIFLDGFQDTKQLLVRLKQSYRLVGLTNTNPLHTKYFAERYEAVHKLFVKIFTSWGNRSLQTK